LILKAVAARVLNDDGKPMSQPYLNDIEHGHKGPPSDGMIRQLARVPGVELDVLRFYANRVCESSLLISIRSSGSFTPRMFWASQDLRWSGDPVPPAPASRRNQRIGASPDRPPRRRCW
jgi:hypothetical protein